MKKLSYYQTPSEFIKEINNASYYDEDRKQILNEAYDNNFDIYQLKLLANVAFNINQVKQIYDGFINNLTLEEVESYANPDFYWKQMEIIKNAYLSNIDRNKLCLLLDKNLDYAQIKEIYEGIKDNLSIDKLKEFSNPNINWKEMNRIRTGRKGMKRLIRKAETKIVNYQDYQDAVNELQNNFTCEDGIEFFTIGFFKDPIQMGVNWSAKGTKTPEETKIFAEKLNKASELAKNFEYNGYVISYK